MARHANVGPEQTAGSSFRATAEYETRGHSSRRNDLFFLAITLNFYRNRWLILLRYIIQFPFTWCQMAMGTEICFEIPYLGALQSPRKIRASVVIKISYVINEHDEKHR